MYVCVCIVGDAMMFLIELHNGVFAKYSYLAIGNKTGEYISEKKNTNAHTHNICTGGSIEKHIKSINENEMRVERRKFATWLSSHRRKKKEKSHKNIMLCVYDNKKKHFYMERSI